MSNWHLSNSYQARLSGTYKDGTSNTLGVTESYARCGDTGTLWAHETVTPDWHAMFNDWNARGAASKFQVGPVWIKPLDPPKPPTPAEKPAAPAATSAATPPPPPAAAPPAVEKPAEGQ